MSRYQAPSKIKMTARSVSRGALYNLLLSMLDMVGVRTERLGDSTGRLTDL